MPLSKVSLASAAAHLKQPFLPINLATVNDMAVNAILCEGKFQWHRHEDMDEIFYVHVGSMLLETELGNVLLHAGELVFAPANVAHCPSSVRPALVLFFLKYRAFPRNGHRRGMSSSRQLQEKVNLAQQARWLKPLETEQVATFDDFAMHLLACDGTQDWHLHEQDDELAFVYEGQARLETQAESVILNAGELAVTPHDMLHRLTAPARATLLLLSRISPQ